MPNLVDVLIVEDEPEMLNIYLEYLNGAGIKTHGAAHPAEGLQFFHELKPRFLVLDQQMPHLSGLDLLQVALARQVKRPTTVLATAYPEIDFTKAARLGVGLVMTKPFRIQKLVSAIESALCPGDDKNSRRWVRIQRPIEVHLNGAPELLLDVGMGGFRIFGQTRETYVRLNFEGSNGPVAVGARKVWEAPRSSGFQFLSDNLHFKQNKGEILSWISKI